MAPKITRALGVAPGGGPRQGALTFGVAAGILIGVLGATIAIPRHSTVRNVLGGQSGGGAGSSPTASSAGMSPGSGGNSSEGGGSSLANGPVTNGPAGGVSGAGAQLQGGTGGGAIANGQTVRAVPPSVRGVTANSITIGIAVPDLGALKNLGAGYDWGNPQVQMQAVLDEWHRSGLVPVNGRDVHFVYSSYNILDANAQRSTCVALTADDGSFAVAGFRLLGAGMPCVTEEHRTPLLMADASGIDDTLLQQAYPYLFSLQMSESRVLRNWPYWGNTRRLLQGKRLGLYYDSSIDADIKQNLLSTLNRLGYKPVVVASTDQSTGGPEDGVVVQQFRAAGVNAALMMVGAVTQTDFMQQADAQGYRPAWIENEYLDNIGDTAPSTYPPAEFDGSFGMAGLAAGQTSAPVSPQANACVDNYVRYTRETRPSVGNAKWNSILISCDLGSALITTLQRAGRALTTTSYIHAMESIEHMVVSYTPPVTFTSAKHAGVDDVRTVRWTAAGCKCWTIVEDYRPLWTP